MLCMPSCIIDAAVGSRSEVLSVAKKVPVACRVGIEYGVNTLHSYLVLPPGFGDRSIIGIERETVGCKV